MKVFSLFSGVGGFELGLPKDWQIIGFSEIDKYASQVLKYHYPNIKNYGDITKIRTQELPNFDLLTGGSPCQDLSIAGKRRGLSGERSGLFMEYIRILRDKKPKYFIWENVKGALSSNYGFDFAIVLNEFSESGYSLWWQVLNAKDFGVPQNRERIFVVGFRDRRSPEVFFESKDSGQIKIIGSTKGEENTRIGERDNVYSVDGIMGGLKATDYKQPPQIIVINKGESQHYRLYDENGLAPTLQSQKGKIRRLMPIECERLMSWPDNYTKYGINEQGNTVEISDSQRYKMCGNGVVSNVVKVIIDNLICA